MCTVSKTVHRLSCCIQYYLYKLSGKRLSGKGLVREMSSPGNDLSAKRMSGKVIVRETSVTLIQQPD